MRFLVLIFYAVRYFIDPIAANKWLNAYRKDYEVRNKKSLDI